MPFVIHDHLTPTQRSTLVIADNRIAENAGWDEARLQVELADLQGDDFDLSLTGFDADALADLLAGEETTSDGQTDEDSVPDAGPSITRPRDFWLCGSQRIICGDSTDASTDDALRAGETAEMVFTDPPYNVDYANTAKDKMRETNRPILNDSPWR